MFSISSVRGSDGGAALSSSKRASAASQSPSSHISMFGDEPVGVRRVDGVEDPLDVAAVGVDAPVVHGREAAPVPEGTRRTRNVRMTSS